MFSLTRQEKLLLISLIGVILLGISINYVLKRNANFVNFYRCSDINLEKSKLNININTANADELMKLPGIGPEIAAAIIQYRNTQGSFKDKEELKNIKGIGEKKFQKIKDLIILGIFSTDEHRLEETDDRPSTSLGIIRGILSISKDR